MSHILTVFGATGNQGKGVIKAIQAHPVLSKRYSIRGVTRDPSKPGLASGVEWVKADLDDASSVQNAVSGSEAVFGVTNFWEKLSDELEIRQGKNIADAAKAAGVKHLIWSSIPSVRRMSKGTITNARHFESKVEVENYIEQIKSPDMIASYVLPGVFMQNFLRNIRAHDDMGRTLTAPYDPQTTMLPLVDAAVDVGLYVAGILNQDPKPTDGIRVQVVSEWLTPNEMVEILSRVTGQQYRFQEVSAEDFKSHLPAAVAEELTDTMRFIGEYHYYGRGAKKDQSQHDRWLLEGAKKKTWAEFVRENME